MAEEETRSLMSLAAEITDLARGRGDIVRLLRLIGEAYLQLLPVDGVSISAMSGPDDRRLLYVSDAVIEQVEAVQFSLGEGPCFETFATGRPVLVADLAADAATSWPVFAAQMTDQPIGALFAFPLAQGAAQVGALELYRRTPGWLTSGQLAVGLRLADLATAALIAALSSREEQEDDPDIDQPWLAGPGGMHLRVHQATGMVMVALSLPAERALSVLRGHAFVTGRLVEDVAADLLARTMQPEELIR